MYADAVSLEILTIILAYKLSYSNTSFTIFAAMKKYAVSIFLSVLFTIALINANVLTIEETGNSSSISADSNSCFYDTHGYPSSEIEHCNVYSYPVVHIYQGFQKIP